MMVHSTRNGVPPEGYMSLDDGTVGPANHPPVGGLAGLAGTPDPEPTPAPEPVHEPPAEEPPAPEPEEPEEVAAEPERQVPRDAPKRSHHGKR